MHIIFLIYFAKLELGKIFLVETNTSDQEPTQYVVRVGGENVSVTKGEGESAKTYSYYEAVISVLTTEEEEEPTYILGDVYDDGTGTVDDIDIMLLDYYFAGMYDAIDTDFGTEHRFWEDPNDPRLLAADVYDDGTGTIDDIDIMLLDYYFAGMYDAIDTDFGPEHRFWEK